ncbi:MAG TPA: NYN domain-containing protein [Thermodesulfobacteriota bacterium]|nr:NYN domain-containing protein [Deltaproteobacteria bacterium]HNR14083.1 NYN domain-containing protein [Thermodesulfobacteriota bacterium]HNU72489.1 NYN domain-containing protein [Thermodesulfobacteriota bacterium]HQO77014.1 NYN domain-containing protein [Thermodesulfobacteriota bacterium]
MALQLIIDGYNLIRQSAALREHDRESLEKGRGELLRKLASYQRIKRYHITVVFDGWIHGETSEGRDRVAGITVQFSRRGEKADVVIRRLASQYQDQAVVVTSDRDLGYACIQEGSEVVSSQEFEGRLELAAYQTLKEDTDAEVDNHTGKKTGKKGPARRLPKAQRRHNQVLKKL